VNPLRIPRDLRQSLGNTLRVARVNQLRERGQLVVEPIGIDRGAGRLADLRVLGRRDRLVLALELLVWLLAGADARVDDLDVAPGLLAREADHVLGCNSSRGREVPAQGAGSRVEFDGYIGDLGNNRYMSVGEYMVLARDI
jgi:hypothetical protein